MELYTASPALDTALVDPANWADEDGIHAQFTWLRANDPLRMLEPEGFDPFWNVTKYDDIKAIEGNKQVFINDPRPTLGPKGMQELVQQLTGRKHLVRSLVQMDDPDHTKYRMLTQSWFMGKNLRKLQADVDALAVKYVDRLADLGGECDFVKDVAIWYPLRVIMTILGVPEEDEALMLKLTQELFGSQDPDNQRSFEPEDFFQVVADFEAYFADLTRARRANPTDDVASLIANAEFDGEPMPEHDANMHALVQLRSGGYAGYIAALAQYPDRAEELDRAGADVAFSTYAEAGAGFAAHVESSIGGAP